MARSKNSGGARNANAQHPDAVTGIKANASSLRNTPANSCLRASMQTRACRPNDPSSATRPAGGVDCNRDAMAGFAAAHGQASWSWLLVSLPSQHKEDRRKSEQANNN